MRHKVPSQVQVGVGTLSTPHSILYQIQSKLPRSAGRLPGGQRKMQRHKLLQSVVHCGPQAQELGYGWQRLGAAPPGLLVTPKIAVVVCVRWMTQACLAGQVAATLR